MDFRPTEALPSRVLPALREFAELAVLRVEPDRDLAGFAAARFFLEPRFCEPWAALVVNAYPNYGNGSTGIVIIKVNHTPSGNSQKMLAFERPTWSQCDVQCQRDLAY